MKAQPAFTALLILCLTPLAAISAPEGHAPRGPTSTQPSPPTPQRATAGITEPIADVTLGASVPGIVSAWKFKEGDFVKPGDTIIQLDQRLEELEAARRKLAMDKTQRDWQALQTLFQKNSISVRKEELEKAETDYKIAATEYEMAAEQLHKRSVTAPCSGHIVEILRDVGEACQPYQPLLRIVDTRQCYFVSNVESQTASRLKLEQTVTLEITTGTTTLKLPGKVIYLSPVVDPASGLQKIRILFDNADGRVRPGVAGKLLAE